MTEYASFDDLTAGVAAYEDIPLQSGKQAQVRGLSRYEYMVASKAMADGVDVAAFEAKITFFGMCQPKLSEKQVEAWQRSPGGFADFQAVHTAIMRLSGMREGADKSDVQQPG